MITTLLALLIAAEFAPTKQEALSCTILPNGIEFCIDDDKMTKPRPVVKQCKDIRGVRMCNA